MDDETHRRHIAELPSFFAIFVGVTVITLLEQYQVWIAYSIGALTFYIVHRLERYFLMKNRKAIHFELTKREGRGNE